MKLSPAALLCAGKGTRGRAVQETSKLLEEAIAAGKLGFLAVEGIVPMQGGLPIIVRGQGHWSGRRSAVSAPLKTSRLPWRPSAD